MDINAEKSLLIEELKQIEDISLLRAIKHMIHYGLTRDGRITVEQYNKEPGEAEEEVKRGDFITHEDVKKQMKAW